MSTVLPPRRDLKGPDVTVRLLLRFIYHEIWQILKIDIAQRARFVLYPEPSYQLRPTCGRRRRIQCPRNPIYYDPG